MSVVDPPALSSLPSSVSTSLHVLAVSPHLDDAAFSAGATLATLAAQGHRVTLVTAFTASVPHPSRFALECQAELGVPPGVDLMAMRRVEDMEAAARLGVQRLVHLPFPEAQYRGYDSDEALMGPLREDDDVAEDLRAALDVLGDHDLILAPLALGDHVDHRQLRRALGLPGRVGDPEPVARFTRGPVALWRDTPHVLLGEDPPTPGDDAVVVSGDALRRKLAACACYSTTRDTQFGGEVGMREALSGLAFEEGRRHGRPAPAEAFAPASPVVRVLRHAVPARPRAA
jgi:LmbE family N-acetylglucosaminyl deacetylase